MKHSEIKELISIFDESDVTKLKINDKEFSITLEKSVLSHCVEQQPKIQIAQTAQAAESITPKTVPNSADVVTINSPMVGTFYVAPSPGSAPFVRVGDKVSKGDTVGIVEAMKIMNEIEAEFDAKIVKMLIEDGQPVEFGTPLFEVEKL